jgi:hypothetical protein
MLEFFRAVSALTVSMDLIDCFWRIADIAKTTTSAKCRYRKLVIRTNDLAEVASLDGAASLHFVE